MLFVLASWNDFIEVLLFVYEEKDMSFEINKYFFPKELKFIVEQLKKKDLKLINSFG